jgi:hypothetical protein
VRDPARVRGAGGPAAAMAKAEAKPRIGDGDEGGARQCRGGHPEPGQ